MGLPDLRPQTATVSHQQMSDSAGGEKVEACDDHQTIVQTDEDDVPIHST